MRRCTVLCIHSIYRTNKKWMTHNHIQLDYIIIQLTYTLLTYFYRVILKKYVDSERRLIFWPYFSIEQYKQTTDTLKEKWNFLALFLMQYLNWEVISLNFMLIWFSYRAIGLKIIIHEFFIFHDIDTWLPWMNIFI